MNIAATAALLLALIPADGQVYQTTAQEFSSVGECLDAHDDVVEFLEQSVDNLWITEHDYHTEVFNLDTLDEYRILCVDDTLITEAS